MEEGRETHQVPPEARLHAGQQAQAQESQGYWQCAQTGKHQPGRGQGDWGPTVQTYWTTVGSGDSGLHRVSWGNHKAVPQLQAVGERALDAGQSYWGSWTVGMRTVHPPRSVFSLGVLGV